MAVEKSTIYIKGNQSVEVKNNKVSVGDLLEIECVNANMLARIKSLTIYIFPEVGKHRVVISLLKIIQRIHEEYPKVEVVSLGAADIIVSYEKEKQKSKFLQGIKVFIVTVITFIGSAFSIMTFNNDVDAAKLFAQIYKQTTGVPKTGLTVLELSYSVGIAVGILIFFNHFGKKKFSADPTPMEVEMRTYENEIQTTLIQLYEREEKEVNVGEASSSGSHRA